ncbi:MAG: TrkH family potassium uptake protein [candidate division KSB1 bacterium]|nr:TrkH family potassium uptake protein [candidate division KSB1 bacterium]
MQRRSEPSSVEAARLLLVSFAGAIAVGTALLVLPAASTGTPLRLIDALFTATSAVCVTGLTVVDTATRLTPYGQAVVLLLLQAGGLGIMTLSTFFSFLVARRVSVRGRELLEETLSGPLSKPSRLLLATMSFTFAAELVGALLLLLRFAPQYGMGQGLWLAVFHSVSAFCNAGFSLFSDSLMRYVGDPLVNGVVASLIILGGLGFLVVYDLAGLRRRSPLVRPSLHTRLVFRTTLALILAGTVLLLFFEAPATLRSLPWPQKLLASFFQSVTARTAGFNTLDIGSMSNASLLVLIALMFIGASPGSTGGGIKTTTFATVVCLVWDRLRGRTDLVMMNRRVSERLLTKAMTVFFLSLALVWMSTAALLAAEGWRSDPQHADFVRYLFEATSAFGTVGLSTGVTPGLSVLGKLILIVTMFVGRLGPVTLALTVTASEVQHFRYPEGEFLVG